MKNTHKPQPFVGVCGIQDVSEYAELLRRTQDITLPPGYFLMAGVKNVTPSATTGRLPDTIRPFVHCDYAPDEPFGRTVERNFRRARAFACGFQLNQIPWMEQDFSHLLLSMKRLYPGVVFMLQAHRPIMENYSPCQIAERVRELAIDYIFFDASQSRGVPYDPAVMRKYVTAAEKEAPHLGVAVAGGLEGQNMERLFAPLAKDHPTLSCDAFGRLQDPTTGKLSWPAVDRYLESWTRCQTS